jgi:hypothetical protein
VSTAFGTFERWAAQSRRTRPSDFARSDRVAIRPTLRSGDRSRSRLGGQALVEFVLVAPILMLLILAIGDFARLYTGEIAVESGAREAADYGAFAVSQWDRSIPGQIDRTVAEMVERACAAVSSLPDYVETGDVTTRCSASGSNPLFSYQLEDQYGTPVADPQVCGLSTTDPPCVVHVTMAYLYHTFFHVPAIPILNFSPYPATLAVQRDSRFAISDIEPVN